MVGAVNAFVLKGQPNNFSAGEDARINSRRWQLMLDKIDYWLKQGDGRLSPEGVRGVMTSYWGDKPRSLLGPGKDGDLYNTLTQQMIFYVPARRQLELFVKPLDNSTPLPPRFERVPFE